MTFEAPRYTRQRGGKLYLNLPIPADMRPHFRTGKDTSRTHIVEALGTGDPTEGRRLARLREAHWVQEFDRLRRGGRGAQPGNTRHAADFRRDIQAALGRGDEDSVEAVKDMAIEHAEAIERAEGLPAAKAFFTLATSPGRLTLLQAVQQMAESGDTTEGTNRKKLQQVQSLLASLQVPDCLPEHVTEARAVAYVEAMNRTTLSKSTKQDRLSGLQTVWSFLERKRQVSPALNPWKNHEVTTPKKDPGTCAEKRGWKDPEVLELFGAPDSAGAKHYTR